MNKTHREKIRTNENKDRRRGGEGGTDHSRREREYKLTKERIKQRKKREQGE